MAAEGNGAGGRTERYSLGYSPGEQGRLGRRTAADRAAFFLPHLRPGMRLLDAGCGPGSITVGLVAAVAPGEVVGVDLEPRQIAAARALAHERQALGVRFAVADVYRLPFPDASFDAAFAYTVLFHLREPVRALSHRHWPGMGRSAGARPTPRGDRGLGRAPGRLLRRAGLHRHRVGRRLSRRPSRSDASSVPVEWRRDGRAHS